MSLCVILGPRLDNNHDKEQCEEDPEEQEFDEEDEDADDLEAEDLTELSSTLDEVVSERDKSGTFWANLN